MMRLCRFSYEVVSELGKPRMKARVENYISVSLLFGKIT
jgi:hypothetical protein